MMRELVSRLLQHFGYVRQDKVNIQMQSIVEKAIELNDENKLLINEMKKKNEQMNKYLNEINSLQYKLTEANEQVVKVEKRAQKQKEMSLKIMSGFDEAYKRFYSACQNK